MKFKMEVNEPMINLFSSSGYSKHDFFHELYYLNYFLTVFGIIS